MNYEQINTATENAISEIRTAVNQGWLKRESDIFAFLCGYTKDEAIIYSLVWEAVRQLVEEGKVEVL